MWVLSGAEKSKLASWKVQMVKIGYGHTTEQVSEIVKRILDQDERANPFLTIMLEGIGGMISSTPS